MSLYQLDVVFPKENVSMSYRLEINDDERRESENDESGRNNESEFKDDSTFILMKNRKKNQAQKTGRVIRYVRFNLKTNTGSYYRENLMLFTSWRNDSSDRVAFSI